MDKPDSPSPSDPAQSSSPVGHPWPFHRVAVVAAALVALSLLCLFTIDVPVSSRCIDKAYPLTKTNWGRALREFGKPWVWIWLCFVWAWAARKRRAALVVMTAMLLTSPTVALFKIATGRPRPRVAREIAAGKDVDVSVSDLAYPSGDTALAFAAAASSAAFLAGGWRIAPFLIAIGVGALRVMSIRHYPADAFAGAATGVLCAWLALRLARFWIGRSPPEWWRRNTVEFGIVLLLPLGETLSGGDHFIRWFRGFGPFVACLLLAFKGSAWLRWTRSRGLGGGLQGLDGRAAASRGGKAMLLIVVLTGLAVIPNLGWLSLYDRDEGYYAECAREMLARRDPFVPHFNGEWWMEKPPLTFWLMSGAMACFGQNEFAARLPSALASLAALYLVYALARRMYSVHAGILSALVLGSMLMFGLIARFALVDMPLLCFVLMSAIGLWKIAEGERTGGLLLFYAGCGLGALTKGPIGIALPALALIGYVLFTRRGSFVWRMKPFGGALLVCAIVGVWALPTAVITQGRYFYELVWVRTIEPLFTPLQGHGGSDLFEYLLTIPVYVPVLLIAMSPWLIFLLPAVRRVNAEGVRADRPALLWGWILAQLAAFSLVRTKLPHHILPLLPPLAIAIGAFLAGICERRGALAEKWSAASRSFFLAGSLLTAVAVTALPIALGFTRDWPWFVPAAVTLIWTAWAAARATACRRGPQAVIAIYAGWLCCLALLWQVAFPRFEQAKAAPRVAMFLNERFPDVRTAWCRGGGFQEVSLVFYMKRALPELDDYAELRGFLEEPGPGAVVMAEEKLRSLLAGKPALGAHTIWRDRVWVPERMRWIELLILANLERRER